MKKTTKKLKNTYLRRGWWPSYWSVVKHKGKWCIKNLKTNTIKSDLFDTEGEAIGWADCPVVTHQYFSNGKLVTP